MAARASKCLPHARHGRGGHWRARRHLLLDKYIAHRLTSTAFQKAHRMPDMAEKGPLAGTPSLAVGLLGESAGEKAKGRSHAGSSIALTCVHVCEREVRRSEHQEVRRCTLLASMIWSCNGGAGGGAPKEGCSFASC